MGTNFHWTLTQEMLFSAALTGKPARKEDFAQYCWKRCVIGTREDYADATAHLEWEFALQRGNLWELKNCNDDALILAPANNTDYNNVSAYLEVFWGYLWPAANHNFNPQIGEWSVVRHSGLKEFIDHVIILMGRPQVKPTTECLRGVATYPQGDMKQGRYGMTLTDLMNTHYTRAVKEAMDTLALGRASSEVAMGDLVEMLLSISFACKDAMLEWSWLGIDLAEWPPQRLDWARVPSKGT